MRRHNRCIKIQRCAGRALGLLLCFALPVTADMLRKQNGDVLDGAFLGGTEHVVYFLTGQGRLDVPVSEILSITFLPSSQDLPDREPTATATVPPSPEISSLTLPVDTRLSVRLTAPLDSMVSRRGDRFEARAAFDVVSGDRVVFPKDTLLLGEVVRSEQGKNGSALVIELREIRRHDEWIPVKTSSYAMWDLPKSGENSGLRVVRTLSIGTDAIVSFKTLEPVVIELEPLQ